MKPTCTCEGGVDRADWQHYRECPWYTYDPSSRLRDSSRTTFAGTSWVPGDAKGAVVVAGHGMQTDYVPPSGALVPPDRMAARPMNERQRGLLGYARELLSYAHGSKHHEPCPDCPQPPGGAA